MFDLTLVNDPQKWLENENNLFHKRLMQMNTTNYGSPFNLSTTSLNINHDELMEKFSYYQKKYSV
jgi:hypothetical protein